MFKELVYRGFDRMFTWNGFRPFAPLYSRYRQIVLYIFFGGIAVFLNLLMFGLFTYVLSVNELIANTIASAVCILFQFFTNRGVVFQAETKGVTAALKQFAAFTAGCLAAFFLEEAVLYIGIFQMHLASAAVKISAQIFVILFNFLTRKYILFRRYTHER